MFEIFYTSRHTIYSTQTMLKVPKIAEQKVREYQFARNYFFFSEHKVKS